MVGVLSASPKHVGVMRLVMLAPQNILVSLLLIGLTLAIPSKLLRRYTLKHIMFNAPKALLVLGSSFFAQCCLSWKDTGAQPAQPAVGNGANFLPCDHRHLFGPFGWCPLPLIVSLTLFGRVWRAHKEFFLFKTCGRVFGNVLHTRAGLNWAWI